MKAIERLEQLLDAKDLQIKDLDSDRIGDTCTMPKL